MTQENEPKHLSELTDGEQVLVRAAQEAAVNLIAGAIPGKRPGSTTTVCAGCVARVLMMAALTVAAEDEPAHDAGLWLTRMVARAAQQLVEDRLRGEHGPGDQALERSRERPA